MKYLLLCGIIVLLSGCYRQPLYAMADYTLVYDYNGCAFFVRPVPHAFFQNDKSYVERYYPGDKDACVNHSLNKDAK
jgi:hypothetical protein